MLLMAVILFSGCQYHIPAETQEALGQSEDNKESLLGLLKYYKDNGEAEKFRATCYLIQGMPYHQNFEEASPSNHKAVDSLIAVGDAAYYSLVKDKTLSEINTLSFYKKLSETDHMYRQRVEIHPFQLGRLSYLPYQDIRNVDSAFLRRHIDNAFRMRKTLPSLQTLSFEDFCHYLLPYRAISDFPFVKDGNSLHHSFYKYLQTDQRATPEEAIQFYNTTAKRLRYFMGNYPFETNIGYNEFYFNGLHDCINLVSYGVDILRACGIPAIAEYNIAYKLWHGRHYHISTLDSLGRWCTFSPESNLPKYRDPKYQEALNIYRIYFTPQSNNPVHLKNHNETIPNEFTDPCIEDVTSNIMDIVEVGLPFRHKTENRLAYLYSFQSKRGMTAVTWGEINHFCKKVTFKSVVPNNLYFPMYYNDQNELEAFDSPFWIKSDSTQSCGYVLEQLTKEVKTLKNINLLRKFPRKPHLKRDADNLIGVVVMASQNEDFSQADTLATISTAPIDYWQEINLSNKKAYKYYRIANKASYPHLHMAEIEFITSKSYGYKNTIPATLLPILPPKTDYIFDTDKVRIIDEPLEKSSWKAEYDQNIYTAPDKWPNVTLKLETPQIVTHVRYIPKTANNGIIIADEYQLMVWNGKIWEEVETIIARQNYLPIKNMQIGKLYWLRNLTEGNEELPFYINEQGEQLFLHTDLLRRLKL